MKVRFGFLFGSLVSFTLAIALAPRSDAAGDINLSWNDCGAAGTKNQSTDCAASGGGPLVLIASFIPPPGISEFVGLSSEIQISASVPLLPDWWKHGVGQCRGTSALSVGFDFTAGPSTCADVFAGQGAGGLAYDVEYGSPSTARLRVQAAIPIDSRGPIDAGTEYYAYKLTIARGAASCSGCNSATCIALRSIQLYQPPEMGNDPELTHTEGRSFVTWQAGGGVAGCSAENSAGNKTWGQLKYIYR